MKIFVEYNFSTVLNFYYIKYDEFLEISKYY